MVVETVGYGLKRGRRPAEAMMGSCFELASMIEIAWECGMAVAPTE